MEVLGGRAIHPINVRVGGFYRAPQRSDLAPLVEPLRRARDHALDTVRWVAGFDVPGFMHDHELLALHNPGEYPIDVGALRSGSGQAFAAADFDAHVVEDQVPHSTALHARLAGVGPLPRRPHRPGTPSTGNGFPRWRRRRLPRQDWARTAATPAATRSAASWYAP